MCINILIWCAITYWLDVLTVMFFEMVNIVCSVIKTLPTNSTDPSAMISVRTFQISLILSKIYFSWFFVRGGGGEGWNISLGMTVSTTWFVKVLIQKKGVCKEHLSVHSWQICLLLAFWRSKLGGLQPSKSPFTIVLKNISGCAKSTHFKFFPP